MGQALWQPTAGLLTTDASPWGWGGHLNQLVPAAGFFSLADHSQYINVKEVAAILFCLASFEDLLDGKHGLLKIKTDNRVAMHVLNGFSSRSAALMTELHNLRVQLLRMCVALDVSLIPSVANGWADALSRRRDRNTWRLAPAWFAALNKRWGRHTVDRFATCNDAHVAWFNSGLHNPGSEGVDALKQQWSGENNWASPPFSMAGEVVKFIEASKVTATVVLPVWQAQWWWTVAMANANEANLLPHVNGLFLSGHDQSPAPRPTWRTAVFRFVDGNRRAVTPPAAAPPFENATNGRTPPPPDGSGSKRWHWQVPLPNEALMPLPSDSCAPTALAPPPSAPTARSGAPGADLRWHNPCFSRSSARGYNSYYLLFFAQLNIKHIVYGTHCGPSHPVTKRALERPHVRTR